MRAKTGWYNSFDNKIKSSWRQQVPKGWEDVRPIQHPVRVMPFTLLMQVPSSSDSRLMKMLARAEPRLAKNYRLPGQVHGKIWNQIEQDVSKELRSVSEMPLL